MSDCVFCKIVKGEIPTEKILNDKNLIAFKDIRPAAPIHILIVPKAHIPTLNDAVDETLLGKMLTAAKDIAKKSGIAETGYRTIINCGRGAGQEVFHLHLHVLGGRPLAVMG